MIRCSSRWASSNSFRASAPTLASDRICGYLPVSSQAMKNGDQSMYGTISFSGKSRSTRVPRNDGTAIGAFSQSMRKRRFTASA